MVNRIWHADGHCDFKLLVEFRETRNELLGVDFGKPGAVLYRRYEHHTLDKQLKFCMPNK